MTLAKRILTTIAGLAMLGYVLHTKAEYETRIEAAAYVQKNLGHIMHAQEEKLNCTFNTWPRVEFQLKYENERDSIALSRVGTLAYYENNTIYIDLDKMRSPEWTFWTSIDHAFHWQKHNVKQIVDHELGHHFMHDADSTFSIDRYIGSERFYGARFISEGVGTYLEGRMNGITNTFNDAIYPADIGPYPIQLFYWTGVHLVSPIIDQYGAEGIRYLMQHVPEEDEVKNLKAYQQRMLDSLAMQHASQVSFIPSVKHNP
jgi:hypothetical protein